MENSKEIFLKTINLERSERCPIGLFWWGTYKYEALELDYKKETWQSGDKISEVDIKFYEKFKPDWFQLDFGMPKYFQDSEIINKDNKQYIVIDPKYRMFKKMDKYLSVNTDEDEEIVDFYEHILGSRFIRPKIDLSSKNKIDSYIERYIQMSSKEIEILGYTDHIKQVSQKYYDDVFTAVYVPSMICQILEPTAGFLEFEKGLLAFYDFPRGMRYFLERTYEVQLNWAKAFAKAGIHAFILSEAYLSSDIVNPKIYRKFLKDIHRDYFKEIINIGLEPICAFCGDINPILKDLTEINVRALWFEESKKNFNIDIIKIREKIGDRVCVFGNLDSINLLQTGNPEDITKEVLRQGEGAKYNFVTANGSPIAPGTPKENIFALINAAREIKWPNL